MGRPYAPGAGLAPGPRIASQLPQGSLLLARLIGPPRERSEVRYVES